MGCRKCISWSKEVATGGVGGVGGGAGGGEQDRYRPRTTIRLMPLQRFDVVVGDVARTNTPESYAFIELRGCHQVAV